MAQFNLWFRPCRLPPRMWPTAWTLHYTTGSTHWWMCELWRTLQIDGGLSLTGPLSPFTTNFSTRQPQILEAWKGRRRSRRVNTQRRLNFKHPPALRVRALAAVVLELSMASFKRKSIWRIMWRSGHCSMCHKYFLSLKKLSKFNCKKNSKSHSWIFANSNEPKVYQIPNGIYNLIALFL